MKTAEITLFKESISLSRKGEIFYMKTLLIGFYKKVIVPKNKFKGYKTVPYYYSVELLNGKKYDVIYQKREIKEILNNKIYNYNEL